jgi:hypothetical protein
VPVNNREDGRHERQEIKELGEGQGSRWIVPLFPRFFHSPPALVFNAHRLCGRRLGARQADRTDELDTFGFPPRCNDAADLM